MKRQSFNLKSIISSLCALLIYGLTAHAESTAPICRPLGELGAKPATRQDVSQASTAAIKALKELDTKAAAILKTAEQLKVNLFERTLPAPSNATQLTELDQSINQLRINIEEAAEKAKSPVEYTHLWSLLVKYFRAAAIVTHIEIYNKPYSVVKIEPLQLKRSLNLPRSTWVTLNISKRILNISDRQSTSELNKVELFISRENIIEMLAQSIAVSPATQQSQKEFLETSKCLMSRLFIDKYMVQKTVLETDVNKIKLPIWGQAPICLGLPAAEFEQTNHDLIVQQSESNFRAELFKAVVPEKISNEISEHESSQDLFKSLASQGIFLVDDFLKLYAYPESYLNVSKDLTPAATKQITDAADKQSDLIATKLPILNTLTTAIETDEFKNIFDNLSSTCLLTGGKDGFEKQKIRFLKLEFRKQYTTINSLLNNYVGRLSDLNDEALRETLTTVLVHSKYQALGEIIDMYLEQYISTKAPEQGTLLEALTDQLYSIASGSVKAALATKEGQEFINAIVAKSQELRTKQSTQPAIIRDNLLAKSFEQAKLAAKYNNPETPLDQLPYNPIYLSKPFDEPMNSLSAKNKERMKLLFQQSTVSGLVSMWNAIEAALKNDAQALGVDCKLNGIFNQTDRIATYRDQYITNWADEIGTALKAKEDPKKICERVIKKEKDESKYQQRISACLKDVENISKGLVSQKHNPPTVDAKQAFRKDCTLMTKVATVMGLKATGQLENIEQVKPYILQVQETSLIFDDEIEDILKVYRKFLVNETLSNARHLLLPTEQIETSLTSKLYSKVKLGEKRRVFEDVSEAANIDAAKPLILAAFEVSNKKLEKRLKEISQVSTEQHLLPLITSSKVLGEILAEYPELQLKFKKLQKQYDRYVRNDQSNWDSISETMHTVFMAWFAIQGARYIPPYLPFIKKKAATLLASGGERLNTVTQTANTALFLSLLPYTAVDVAVRGKRLYEYDNLMSERESLYYADAIPEQSFSLSENPFDKKITLLNYEKFYQQELLFDGLRSKENSALIDDAITLSLWYAMGRLASPFATNTRFSPQGQAKILNTAKTSDATKAASAHIAGEFRRDMMRLDHVLSKLKDPRTGQLPSFRLSELQRARQVIRQSGLGLRHVHKAERSYEEIVRYIGSRVEQMMGEERYLKAYAKAVFKENGRIEDLYDIYEEYVRVIRLRGAGSL